MQGGEARLAGRQAPIRSSRRRTSKNSRVSWRAGGGLAADEIGLALGLLAPLAYLLVALGLAAGAR
jgi:hypothetical protein